jgi:hypothetical protein
MCVIVMIQVGDLDRGDDGCFEMDDVDDCFFENV